MDALVRQDAIEFKEQEKNNENIANQNDSGCETSTTKSTEEILTTSTNTIETIDVLVARSHQLVSRKQINKAAYAKLQRSLSPTRNSQLDSLKSKYEKSDNENEIDIDNDKPEIRSKSKLPLPVPRSCIKSEIILPSQKLSDKLKHRHSLMLDKKTKKKDENSNEVFRKNSSSSGEFITIIPRSESIETVDEFEKELNLFTMDKKVKDKKRTNSFRKIFSGRIFNKEKKKKEETENRIVQSDNLQNENNFSRQIPQRISIVNSNIPKPVPHGTHRFPPKAIDMHEIERKYAQMHVKEFNNIKQNFENQNNHDETDEIATLTPGPMDFNKVPNINKFIDTSSSASVESDKDNSSKNFTEQENPYKSLRFADNQRDTPPRAQELRQIQDVRLVNPKALLPINTERPLPNPYQNSTKPVISPKPKIIPLTSPKPKMVQQFNYSSEKRPILDETYGTVIDSIDKKTIQKPPKSPSLEPSKLRLPPNRDIGHMSPRMRSPIPQHHVSTEKLIATELLRTSRSPTPTKKKINQLSSSHQKLEMNIDYPDNISSQYTRGSPVITSKPPISRSQLSSPISRMPERNSQISFNYENINYQSSPISNIRNSQISPNYENRNDQSPSSIMLDNESLQRNSQLPLDYENRNYQSSHLMNSQERLIRNHQSSPLVNSQERLTGNSIVMRSPTPSNILPNAELTLVKPNSRSSTPVDLRIPNSNSTPSPQKEEMRRSVEAYYWKEIKKLKEQENRDLYYYQMHMMPLGYAEDPINYRRSRSSSPSSQRNGRRSLSLPRETKSKLVNVEVNDNYGRYQPTPIPEGRAVVNYPTAVYYQQNFRRNAPERRTIDSVPRSNGNTIYRPIFKRGSLTTPVREFVEDPQQKKVSFTGNREKKEAWPTRNGYTQSPPQRRIESIRPESIDDDVFFPQQTSKLIVDGKEIYGYTNHILRQQDPHYQNTNFYKQIHQEPVYMTQNNKIEDTSKIPRGMTRYNSMQLTEPVYGQQQRLSRRMSFDNSQNYVPKPQMQQNVKYNMPRRQIYVKDDVYGYFGGYVPNDQGVVYSSRQNIAEPTYGYSRGLPKQITMREKVCDMYGQIHDRDSPSIRKSGVMLGQLQPAQISQPPNQNFVRNSRLTASANDMYRKYQNVEPRYPNNLAYEYQVQSDRPPSRPLPPVPTDKNVYYRQNTDSIQEFSDVQKSGNLGKNKKRGIFGQTENAFKETNANGERFILVEQIQLLRRQQELELNKWQWQQYHNSFQDKNQKYRRYPEETRSTEQRSISDLKKLVLLEELKLLRLKIKLEPSLK